VGFGGVYYFCFWLSCVGFIRRFHCIHLLISYNNESSWFARPVQMQTSREWLLRVPDRVVCCALRVNIHREAVNVEVIKA
jgi:hypothetical protein